MQISNKQKQKLSWLELRVLLTVFSRDVKEHTSQYLPWVIVQYGFGTTGKQTNSKCKGFFLLIVF